MTTIACPSYVQAPGSLRFLTALDTTPEEKVQTPGHGVQGISKSHPNLMLIHHLTPHPAHTPIATASSEHWAPPAPLHKLFLCQPGPFFPPLPSKRAFTICGCLPCFIRLQSPCRQTTWVPQSLTKPAQQTALTARHCSNLLVFSSHLRV